MISRYHVSIRRCVFLYLYNNIYFSKGQCKSTSASNSSREAAGTVVIPDNRRYLHFLPDTPKIFEKSFHVAVVIRCTYTNNKGVLHMRDGRYTEYAHLAIKYRDKDLNDLFYFFIRNFDKSEKEEAITRFHLFQMVAQNARRLSKEMINELDQISAKK